MSDPRVVLGYQIVDDEGEDEVHCAVCAVSEINLTNVSPKVDLRNKIVAAYADDAVYAGILTYLCFLSDETLGALSRNTTTRLPRRRSAALQHRLIRCFTSRRA
ncbi:hypothetical protein PF005_g8975 [Phytophthora fragariae]|uniref:Uncharacterized protein n=1 Tax=Phytophthora fragariae TaxID=53985 RepID=A0A6A3YD74_9STRA|nr:hypothetical protein PF003_g3055 [Phytophthora fragariae]KAE9112109.1 hypothetical protein PF007_g11221 [Phytophthora fragariae]KAE9135075.1 hypothetical protein PF006_g14688 [Phytophthora fragariae]KAE9216641.1 hypothetical protein PF005_g8975 [Phytophthora fragariae]KAE9232016.1 hypothetical protein PF002_g12513 [Phytophthora fragariae]